MKIDKRRELKCDLAIAGCAFLVGLAISGWATADIISRDHMHLAQATQPLQSTPGAESKPSAPNTIGESQGVRPADVAPQPARPEPNEVKAGTPQALPPAPAEKSGTPIPSK